MYLLFVIDSLGSGGAQRQIVTLATGLQNLGHNVELFIYYPQFKHFSDELEEKGIFIHSYQKINRFDPRVVFKLRKIIKNRKYDSIISFLYTPNFYAELSRAFLTNIPLIVSERSTYPFGKISMSKKILEQIYRKSTHITVNSHHHREQMIRIHPWIKSKISTIYNGVDLKTYYPNTIIDNKKYYSSTTFIVLGTITHIKNVIGLVNALVYYKEKYGDPPIIKWVGKLLDNKEDRQLYDNANKLLKVNNLTHKWEWFGEQKNVIKLLQSSDALIQASLYEGLPNSICEAFACGKPVIASNVCEHPRLIKEAKSGFLFDPGKPSEIANVLYTFCNLSNEKKKKMGYNARKYAEREFSKDIYVDRYESLIFNVVKEYKKE